jgi:outer membrane protein TolC
MRAITLLWVLIVSFALGGQAQTLSTNNTRSLSLEECIKSALEKNLSLQLAQIDVRIARNRFWGAYGYYDPRFDMTANYSLASSEDTINFQAGTLVAPGERTAHTLTAGFVGALPWGMRYDLGADLSYLRRTGTQRFRTNEVDMFGVTNEVDRVQPFDLDSYNVDTGIAITQPLLRNFWIDQGRMTIKFNRAAVNVSQLALLEQVNQIVRDVMLNYYELIFAVENVRVNEKAFELAQRLAAENKKRVEVGTLAPLDEKQAEAQAATARAALIAAMQQAGTQQRRLINLITDNYEQWQNMRLVPTETLVAVPRSYNLPSSWVEALTKRPDFNRIKEQVEQQGIEVTFRQNQLFPQLDLVGTYGRLGIDRRIGGALHDIREDTLPRYSFGLVFSVPLENRTARSQYRDAKLLRDRLKKELELLHQQVLVDVEIAVGAAQAEFERVAATREASLAAEAAYDAEVKKLENGKSTSFNVLSLQNDLTTARSEHIRALADYNRALAELYYQEGTILDRSKIRVER